MRTSQRDSKSGHQSEVGSATDWTQNFSLISDKKKYKNTKIWKAGEAEKLQ
jgi:hypothetical protein